MKQLFALGVLTAAIFGATLEAQREVSRYVGTWRLEESSPEDAGPPPFILLQIATEDDAVLVQRSGNNKTEQVRYVVGQPTTNTESGHEVETTATFDGPALVVASKPHDAGAAGATDVYRMVLNKLVVERTIGAGAAGKTVTMKFRRIPGNYLTHGGTGMSGNIAPSRPEPDAEKKPEPEQKR